MISRRLQSLTKLVRDTGTITLRPSLLLWAGRLLFLECWIQELVQRKQQPDERSTINKVVVGMNLDNMPSFWISERNVD